MNRYTDWILSTLCWDGALPIAVVSLPNRIMLAWPGRPGLVQVIALLIPITAFFVRGAHGFKRNRAGQFRLWQTAMFVIGILLLALWETTFILFTGMPNIAQHSDWYILWALYSAYVISMAIAFFPMKVQHLPTIDVLTEVY